MTFSLTDGNSTTDHDGLADGTIVDPFVPGVPAAVGGVAERITLTPLQQVQIWLQEGAQWLGQWFK